MVLGFGTKKKKPVTEPVFIRVSPSLPELTQQRIPWPESLIDTNVVEEVDLEPPVMDAHAGARKVSFQSSRAGSIPFHKPFRAGADSPVSLSPTKTPSAPPSAFNGVTSPRRAGSHPLSHSRSTRRSKNPLTFNVMVAGAKHTGKSSLLRLLLDTSTISPANTQEQLISLSTFRAASARPTNAINTACVEILHSPAGRAPTLDDRVGLTCIDTPGLDFSEGKEFALDYAVSDIVRYVDLQFAETLGEESKVVRTSKGDQHVHLCIYLIDPDSVMTPSGRRAKTRITSELRSQVAATVDGHQPSEYDSGSDDESETDGLTASGDHQTDDGYGNGNGNGNAEPGEEPMVGITGEDATPRVSVETNSRGVNAQDQRESVARSEKSSRTDNRLTLSPAEIRVISRLAKRVNVLPVVARADTLTDGRLERIKRAIRRDLQGVSIGGDEENENISIFGVWDAEPGALFGRRGAEKEYGNGNGNGSVNGHGMEEEDERQSRPVIKLRDRASSRGLARSRSRKSLKAAAGVEYDASGQNAQAGYAASMGAGRGDESTVTRRTSVESTGGAALFTPSFSRADLRTRIPFAVIAPERERDKGNGTAASSQHGHGQGADWRGKFVRRFRWGTVDVLDPQHCDFAALRTAVLGSYMRALKTATKDVLYERFRTEKLLVRRATRNITDEDRKRIMQDLDL